MAGSGGQDASAVPSRFRLGLPEMDAQHDYLYDLFDLLVLDMPPAQCEALLHEIEGMLDFHFTSEEHLMRHYRVPGFAVHQSDHEQAARVLLQGIDAFEAGKLQPARLRNSLSGWLAEHSRSADREYADLIREHRTRCGWCK